MSIKFSNMHVRCESECHTDNNRPTGKIISAELQKKAIVEKKHNLDDSITNITPANTITNETKNTYTNQIISLSGRWFSSLTAMPTPTSMKTREKEATNKSYNWHTAVPIQSIIMSFTLKDSMIKIQTAER